MSHNEEEAVGEGRQILYWPDLLYSTPMILCLLGQIFVISSKRDFSLTDKDQPVPKFMKYPHSNIGTMEQLIHEATNAFMTAEKNMDRISNNIPDIFQNIDDAARYVQEAPPDELKKLLEIPIDFIKRNSLDCIEKARNTEAAFESVNNLIQEIVDFSSNTLGRDQNNKETAENLKTETEKERKRHQDLLKKYEKEVNETRAKVKDSEAAYDKALNALPSSWELLGMDVVRMVTQGAMKALEMLAMARTGGLGAGVMVAEDMIKSRKDPKDPNQPPDEKAKASGADNSVKVAQSLADCEGYIEPVLKDLNGFEINPKSPEHAAEIAAKAKTIESFYQGCVPSVESVVTSNGAFKQQAIGLAKTGLEILTKVATLTANEITKVQPYKIELDNTVRDMKSQMAQAATEVPGKDPVPVEKAKLTNEQLRVELKYKQLELNEQKFERTRAQADAMEEKLTDTINKLANLDVTIGSLTVIIGILNECVDQLRELQHRWMDLARFFEKVATSAETAMSNRSALAKFVEKAQQLAENSKLAYLVKDYKNYAQCQVFRIKQVCAF